MKMEMDIRAWNGSFCVNNSTLAGKDKEAGLSAFLYIVVVMLFYATAMVVLVVKYLRGERHEASLRTLYADFIERQDFVESRNLSERLEAVNRVRQMLSSKFKDVVRGGLAHAACSPKPKHEPSSLAPSRGNAVASSNQYLTAHQHLPPPLTFDVVKCCPSKQASGDKCPALVKAL